MSIIQFKKTPNNNKSIERSLQYLLMEAKKDNNERLTSIIGLAIKLSNGSYLDSDLLYFEGLDDQDHKVTLIFLLKFMKLPAGQKSEVMSAIEESGNKRVPPVPALP